MVLYQSDGPVRDFDSWAFTSYRFYEPVVCNSWVIQIFDKVLIWAVIGEGLKNFDQIIIEKDLIQSYLILVNILSDMYSRVQIYLGWISDAWRADWTE